MKKDIIQNVDNRIQGNTCETENSGFFLPNDTFTHARIVGIGDNF